MLQATLNTQICYSWPETKSLLDTLNSKSLEHTAIGCPDHWVVAWAQIEDKPELEPVQLDLLE
ncbi:hypothetical protein [Aliivibrio fischeri]|uniref:hypothetical protein n=1 Tax=Aliivibrio fischeri TaxID=668 RepID=UPI0007C453C3|nr:hypothetical protein [Aliivibrio fischeri]